MLASCERCQSCVRACLQDWTQQWVSGQCINSPCFLLACEHGVVSVQVAEAIQCRGMHNRLAASIQVIALATEHACLAHCSLLYDSNMTDFILKIVAWTLAMPPHTSIFHDRRVLCRSSRNCPDGVAWLDHVKLWQHSKW